MADSTNEFGKSKITNMEIKTVEKFAKTETSAFKRALEVVLSEMGIEGRIPGAYDLFSEFMYTVNKEQAKAREYLSKQNIKN